MSDYNVNFSSPQPPPPSIKFLKGEIDETKLIQKKEEGKFKGTINLSLARHGSEPTKMEVAFKSYKPSGLWDKFLTAIGMHRWVPLQVEVGKAKAGEKDPKTQTIYVKVSQLAEKLICSERSIRKASQVAEADVKAKGVNAKGELETWVTIASSYQQLKSQFKTTRGGTLNKEQIRFVCKTIQASGTELAEELKKRETRAAKESENTQGVLKADGKAAKDIKEKEGEYRTPLLTRMSRIPVTFHGLPDGSIGISLIGHKKGEASAPALEEHKDKDSFVLDEELVKGVAGQTVVVNEKHKPEEPQKINTGPKEVNLEGASHLGSGTYKVVHKMVNFGTAKTYALGVAKTDTDDSMQKEAYLLDVLKDVPGVLKAPFQHTITYQGREAIVMELSKEGTLNTRVKPEYVGEDGEDEMYVPTISPKEWGENLDIFEDVLEGIEGCHKNKVVLSDIKPANILVLTDENGHKRAVLSDLGIAFLRGGDPAKCNTEWYGSTPLYKAPELYTEEASDKIDEFAAGVAMAELFSQKKIPWNSAVTRNLNALEALDKQYKKDIKGKSKVEIKVINERYIQNRDKINKEAKEEISRRIDTFRAQLNDLDSAYNKRIPIGPIIAKLIDPDPNDRITAAEARKEIQALRVQYSQKTDRPPRPPIVEPKMAEPPPYMEPPPPPPYSDKKPIEI